MVVASGNLSTSPSMSTLRKLLDEGRHDVADQWNCDHGAGQNVESETKLQKKVAATDIAISISTSGFGGVLGFVRAHRSAFLLPLGQREGCPNSFFLWETSQATTPEISSSDIGLPERDSENQGSRGHCVPQ